ncbi:ComEC/Rec2 family competence protein [Streptomyces mangrovisoli]|uniref:Metallo-beta-lactamase domain-containing protein n=1 Tax=Streptomyces mangrovisoli TaxID=1428628 RepID=A0A1J4NLZ9_9ACTN|nr:hypothetical protein [Streptomyces mangrovisoli]OIJ63170.1 hypothetical protein WN71_035585 [Streptomyces mangrovisoli]
MGHEIDFLPVGEESKGGDAIALRFGNLRGRREEQTVMVVDGGYTDCGDALVEHIKKHYGTDRIDIVVSTHTDQDHICGLKTVLEKMSVGQLLMHLPWDHSEAMERARTSAYWRGRLNDPARRMLEAAMELEAVARRRGVEIVEPFAGVGSKDGVFNVLGPTAAYYEQLLSDLLGRTAASSAQLAYEALVRKMLEAAKKLVPESWLAESLRDDGTTTPANNASVVSLLETDGMKMLLTGDAGIPALTHVADALEDIGFAPGDLDLVQVPHHGSRRNVGPTILDRLLGPMENGVTRGIACVSAPRKNPDHRHPAKKVTNAFLRRGYPVYATQGATLTRRHDAPNRAGYGPAQSLPFHHMVEDDGGA